MVLIIKHPSHGSQTCIKLRLTQLWTSRILYFHFHFCRWTGTTKPRLQSCSVFPLLMFLQFTLIFYNLPVINVQVPLKLITNRTEQNRTNSLFWHKHTSSSSYFTRTIACIENKKCTISCENVFTLEAVNT